MPQHYHRVRIGLGPRAKGCLLFYGVLGVLLVIVVAVGLLLGAGNRIGLWNVPLPEGGAPIPQRLRSTAAIVQTRALYDLSKMPPDRSNREIAEGLKAALQSSDGQVRSDAAAALAAWGNPEDAVALVPIVVESADPRNLWARPAAWRSMCLLGEAQATEPLAQRLKVPRDRTAASAALLKIGAPAEAAVLDLLQDDGADIDGRLEAAVLLQHIGTGYSLPTLRRIAAAGAPRITDPAKRAIKDIEARIGDDKHTAP